MDAAVVGPGIAATLLAEGRNLRPYLVITSGILVSKRTRAVCWPRLVMLPAAILAKARDGGARARVRAGQYVPEIGAAMLRGRIALLP
eukprot:9196249-Alexandrium_andersonii.AAC.1